MCLCDFHSIRKLGIIGLECQLRDLLEKKREGLPLIIGELGFQFGVLLGEREGGIEELIGKVKSAAAVKQLCDSENLKGRQSCIHQRKKMWTDIRWSARSLTVLLVEMKLAMPRRR